MASTHRPTVHSREGHFDRNDDENGDHGDEAGHGWIGAVPEWGETWVGEGCESSWEEVDESSSYKDASTEAVVGVSMVWWVGGGVVTGEIRSCGVLAVGTCGALWRAKLQKLMRNPQLRELFDYEWE